MRPTFQRRRRRRRRLAQAPAPWARPGPPARRVVSTSLVPAASFSHGRAATKARRLRPGRSPVRSAAAKSVWSTGNSTSGTAGARGPTLAFAVAPDADVQVVAERGTEARPPSFLAERRTARTANRLRGRRGRRPAGTASRGRGGSAGCAAARAGLVGKGHERRRRGARWARRAAARARGCRRRRRRAGRRSPRSPRPARSQRARRRRRRPRSNAAAPRGRRAPVHVATKTARAPPKSPSRRVARRDRGLDRGARRFRRRSPPRADPVVVVRRRCQLPRRSAASSSREPRARQRRSRGGRLDAGCFERARQRAPPVGVASASATSAARCPASSAQLSGRGRPPGSTTRPAPSAAWTPRRLDGTGTVALAARSPERLLELVPRERRAGVSSLPCDRLGAGDGGRHGVGVAAKRRRRRAGRRHRARGRRLEHDGGHGSSAASPARRATRRRARARVVFRPASGAQSHAMPSAALIAAPPARVAAAPAKARGREPPRLASAPRVPRRAAAAGNTGAGAVGRQRGERLGSLAVAKVVAPQKLVEQRPRAISEAPLQPPLHSGHDVVRRFGFGIGAAVVGLVGVVPPRLRQYVGSVRCRVTPAMARSTRVAARAARAGRDASGGLSFRG